MNREVLMKTAAYMREVCSLREDNAGFDLAHWFGFNGVEAGHTKNGFEAINAHTCGTTGCVAGWTIFAVEGSHLPVDKVEGLYGFEDPGDRAAELLDLSSAEASNLFYWGPSSVWTRMAAEYGWALYEGTLDNPSEITCEQAAEVLERVARGDIVL